MDSFRNIGILEWEWERTHYWSMVEWQMIYDNSRYENFFFLHYIKIWVLPFFLLTFTELCAVCIKQFLSLFSSETNFPLREDRGAAGWQTEWQLMSWLVTWLNIKTEIKIKSSSSINKPSFPVILFRSFILFCTHQKFINLAGKL